MTPVTYYSNNQNNAPLSRNSPISNLSHKPGGISNISGFIHLTQRAFEFFRKGENGDYPWKFWKKNKETNPKYTWIQDDGYWTWMNTASKVGLTACNAIDAVRFINYIATLTLKVASSFLFYIKNILILPVILLNVADSGYHIHVANNRIKHCETIMRDRSFKKITVLQNSKRIIVQSTINIISQVTKFTFTIITLTGYIFGLITPVFSLITTLGFLTANIIGFCKVIYCVYNPIHKIV
ncbi:MAG: hypothetical protein VX777_08020 [Chlamydiota bacterium]|nr:hypothetical protein [Chlamydiota bacterium]